MSKSKSKPEATEVAPSTSSDIPTEKSENQSKKEGKSKSKKDKKQKKSKTENNESKAETTQWSLVNQQSFDSELDNLFSAAPAPISTPVATTNSNSTTPSSKRKRSSESAVEAEPQAIPSQTSKDSSKQSKKAKKSQDQQIAKEKEEAALVEGKYAAVPRGKESKKDKADKKEKGKGKQEVKDVEREEVNENDEEELDLEPLVDDGQDEEEGELLGEVDEDDSEEDDENPNAPPPVHESLLRKGQKSSKPISKKAEDDEPREVKDKRTLFVGNLPIEAVRSRSTTKALKRHLISFSPYPTLTSISSIRYRSIPFSTPTDDFIAGDDEASSKAAKRRERTSTYREAQALADREEKGEDENANYGAPKTFLNAKQKRKVAFIKQDFNSHASSVNAYVTLRTPDAEEIKKLREFMKDGQDEIPSPPTSLNGPLLAALVSHTANNTLFSGRHIRVDLVSSLAVQELLQSGLDKTSPLFKAMVSSTTGSGVSNGKSSGTGRDEKKTLFVGNLDFEASEEELRDFFEDLLIQERGNPPENEGGKSLRSLVLSNVRKIKASGIKPVVEDEEAEDGEDSDSENEDEEKESTSSWVSSVRIIRDPSTQLGKGFAYVLFIDEICVDELIALHETEENFLQSGRPQVGGLRGKGNQMAPPPSSYGKEFKRRLKFKKRPMRLSRCKGPGGGNKAGKDGHRNAMGNFTRSNEKNKDGNSNQPSTPGNKFKDRKRAQGAPTPGGTSPHHSKTTSTSDGPSSSSLDAVLLSALTKEERANLKRNDPGRLARRMEKKASKKPSKLKNLNLEEEGRKTGRQKVSLNRNSLAAGKAKKGKDGKDGKKRSSTGNMVVAKKSKSPGGKKPTVRKQQRE